MANAGDRRIAVLLRVVAKQLVRDQHAIGPAAHHVGERAAPVNPELPALDAVFFHGGPQSKGALEASS